MIRLFLLSLCYFPYRLNMLKLRYITWFMHVRSFCKNYRTISTFVVVVVVFMCRETHSILWRTNKCLVWPNLKGFVREYFVYENRQTI